MNTDRLRGDECGLSPVIGVVVMVAITVLLGATTTSVFLGLSDDNIENTAPTAKFSFEYEDNSGSDTVTIRHESGDNIVAKHTSIRIEGATCVGGTDDPNGRYNLATDFQLPGPEMTAGMTVQIRPNTDFTGGRELCTDGGDLDLSTVSLAILWESDGSASATIFRWDGP